MIIVMLAAALETQRTGKYDVSLHVTMSGCILETPSILVHAYVTWAVKRWWAIIYADEGLNKCI